jgi:hypothetical protein
MPKESLPAANLPKGWKPRVRSAVLHVISLAKHSLVIAHGQDRSRHGSESAEREGLEQEVPWALEYSQCSATDLYFNLVYYAMDHAFPSGARAIHVGQTADRFKSLLGCSGNRRYIYCRGLGPIVSWILRQASGLLFPYRPDLAPHNVFKALVSAGEPSQLCASERQ